ncbi:Steroid receptor RNA activator-protein/coat protein complex II, Sec31 [Cinara cedri]|uniref:Steroid receptor RNA activator-protein/coat protein complex II, Sec31 n=1 Tax=Cinara cedri TaxID=506608 RepID=A0A5E4M6W6_9HEMI|nr:Steroid receptor RNA activator-protein/coat protein complex II, Sec31 [Cinara cedri]
MTDGYKPYTPGWNDPPSYSFEDTLNAQQGNRPKIFDRIPARVLANGQIPESKTEKYQIPLYDNVSSNENNNDVSAISTSNLCDFTEEERLSYVMESLSVSIQKSTLPESKKLDITKRLSRLEISWKDNQFTDIIQQKTIALVKAIETNNYTEANKLQMSLMVDHTRQCNSWIPAIRQLINQHT